MVAARSVQPVRRHCTACVSSPAKQDGWRAIGGPPTHSHSATGPAQAGQAGELSQATFMTRWWVLARARVLVRVWVAVARGGDFTQVAPKPTSQPSVHEAPWVRFEMFAGQLPQTPLVGGATPLQLRKMHESSSCRRHGGKVSDRRAAPGATGAAVVVPAGAQGATCRSKERRAYAPPPRSHSSSGHGDACSRVAGTLCGHPSQSPDMWAGHPRGRSPSDSRSCTTQGARMTHLESSHPSYQGRGAWWCLPGGTRLRADAVRSQERGLVRHRKCVRVRTVGRGVVESTWVGGCAGSVPLDEVG